MKKHKKKEKIVVTQALIEETTSVKKIEQYMELLLHIQNSNSFAMVLTTSLKASMMVIVIMCLFGGGVNMFISPNPINHPNYDKILGALCIVLSCIITAMYIVWIRKHMKPIPVDHKNLLANKALYNQCKKRKARLLEDFTQEISTLSVDTRGYIAENGL